MANSDFPNNEQRDVLKRNFQRCQGDLIQALNGIDRPIGTAEEIVELKRAVLRSEHACIKHGVSVETVWDFAAREHEKHLSSVLDYAKEQAQLVPVLPNELRDVLPWFLSICAFAFAYVAWGSLGWALIGGVAVYLGITLCLIELLPTPSMRVGRMAAERSVDVSDIWPTGSRALREYTLGYRLTEIRNARRTGKRNRIKIW